MIKKHAFVTFAHKFRQNFLMFQMIFYFFLLLQQKKFIIGDCNQSAAVEVANGLLEDLFRYTELLGNVLGGAFVA